MFLWVRILGFAVWHFRCYTAFPFHNVALFWARVQVLCQYVFGFVIALIKKSREQAAIFLYKFVLDNIDVSDYTVYISIYLVVII